MRFHIFFYFYTMKLMFILFFFVFGLFSGQKKLPLDSLEIKNAQAFFIDDYAHIYLYRKNDFSFTKYDSTGKVIAKLMMPVPFRVQGVQNPLTMILFSENAQELKFLDQNLNEIQKINFQQKFGFIRAAYAEDLQQVWLLDESSRRLLQYNYRQDLILNSFPLGFDFDRIIAMLVYENRLYLIDNSDFKVYDLKGNLLFKESLKNPIKLSRENNKIFIIGKEEILGYDIRDGLKPVFQKSGSRFVDKNSISFVAVKDGKVYLYKIENEEFTKK